MTRPARSRFDVPQWSTRDRARASTNARGTSLVGSSPVPLITESDVAVGVCDAVIPFSAKDLARITGKSVEAAKAWKSGDRTLNSAQLINMARSLDAVRNWLADECGWTREGQAQSSDTIIRWAITYRNNQGEDGAIARAVLAAIGRQ